MSDDPVMSMATVDSQEVSPKEILRFAKAILSVISFMAILGGISELVRPENNVFTSIREVLPPMATMVMGFYFGKST